MEEIKIAGLILLYIYLGCIAITISLIICFFKLCGRIKKIEEINKEQLENLEAILKTEIEIKNKKD